MDVRTVACEAATNARHAVMCMRHTRCRRRPANDRRRTGSDNLHWNSLLHGCLSALSPSLSFVTRLLAARLSYPVSAATYLLHPAAVPIYIPSAAAVIPQSSLGTFYLVIPSPHPVSVLSLYHKRRLPSSTYSTAVSSTTSTRPSSSSDPPTLTEHCLSVRPPRPS